MLPPFRATSQARENEDGWETLPHPGCDRTGKQLSPSPDKVRRRRSPPERTKAPPSAPHEVGATQPSKEPLGSWYATRFHLCKRQPGHDVRNRNLRCFRFNTFRTARRTSCPAVLPEELDAQLHIPRLV